MYHFFVTPAQIMDGYAVITGQDVNHIRNVLRMKTGEQVGIRDGISRSYICELETIGEAERRAKILYYLGIFLVLAGTFIFILFANRKWLT